jgi:hypothetical protein
VRPNRFLRLWYVYCKLWIYLAPRLTLSLNRLKRDSTWPTSPRSSIGCVQNDFWAYGTFGANRASIWNQDYDSIQTDRNELPFDPHHLGVPSGVSKIISKPMVRLAQTMHLSCTETNTISKTIEMRFYMTHVTLEFHRVHPNRFLRIWYVCCKLWIYLAPILTLSPNGPKWDSTWPTSPRSSIGCVQNNFWAYGTFGANRAPILNQD